MIAEICLIMRIGFQIDVSTSLSASVGKKTNIFTVWAISIHTQVVN